MSSQDSSSQEDDPEGVAVVADVHDRGISPHLYQGDTEPPGFHITGLIYSDDVTPLHANRKEVKVGMRIYQSIGTINRLSRDQLAGLIPAKRRVAL